MDEFSSGQFSDADEFSSAAYQTCRTQFDYEEECWDENCSNPPKKFYNYANNSYIKSASEEQSFSDVECAEDMNAGKGCLTERLNGQRSDRYHYTTSSTQTSTIQPNEKSQGEHCSNINMEKYCGLNGSVANQMSKHESNQYKKIHCKDKSYKSTVENEFDTRLRSYLCKTINHCEIKDALMTIDQAFEIYLELVTAVRKMYRECKLVHADLSEDNILFFEEKPYIINVSQSVGIEHPKAFAPLKNDISNITDFFHKKGLKTMSPSHFLDFVVSKNVNDATVDQYLARVEAKNRASSEVDTDDLTCLNEISTLYTDSKSREETINELSYAEVLGLDVTNICLNDEEATDNGSSTNGKERLAEENDAADESTVDGAVALKPRDDESSVDGVVALKPAGDVELIDILSPEERQQKYKSEMERRLPSVRAKRGRKPYKIACC